MASITKRNDTYTIRVSLGYDSTGKQIQKFKTWKPPYGMTPKQIEKELERQKFYLRNNVGAVNILTAISNFLIS